jgi:hypothetical protein
MKQRDVITESQCVGGYRLPEGLAEGARVKVVGVDIGARDVEFEGRRFRIAMPCVDNGLEFWVDGKWISETPVLNYCHGQD